MDIQSVEFLTSYAGTGKVPDWGLPEIAVVGRSNSGKSSFINAVLGRKQIAHVSSKPGKTQTVNYFVVNADFIFLRDQKFLYFLYFPILLKISIHNK